MTGDGTGVSNGIIEEIELPEEGKLTVEYEYDRSMGRVKGARKLEAGDSLHFTVTPKEGFGVVSVIANGVELEPLSVATDSDLEDESGELSYVLIEVEEDVEIEVEFAGIALLSLLADIPLPDGSGHGVEYKTMSEYVVPNLDEFVVNGTNFEVKYTIQENNEDELTVILDEEMLYCLDKLYDSYLVPGDVFNWDIQFDNQSGNIYRYKEGSLVVAPADLSDLVEADLATYGEDYPHVTGYDGQLIPVEYSKHRVQDNAALKALFNVDKATQISLVDMLCLYDALAEIGYVGEQPLTDYYLDYYNDKYGTDASTIMELPKNAFADIMAQKLSTNGLFFVSNEDALNELEEQYPYMAYTRVKPVGNRFQVELIEMEPQLSAIIYNDWYRRLLGLSIGEKLTTDGDSDGVGDVGIAMYMTGMSDIWDRTDQYLTENMVFSKEKSVVEFPAGISLNGPLMGNVYQLYPFDFYIEFTLERVITEGSLTINKVDDDGQMIANPAVFVIYKEEDGKTLYRTGDGWSENKADAEEYTTSGGSVVVPSLDLGVTYYVEEVKAPEGYELVTVPRPVEMSEESMEINFSNKAQYTIIINYYEDGTTNKLTDSYVSDVFTKGEAFDVTTEIQKTINGYNWTRCDQEVYVGVIDGNLVFNVYYTRRSSGNHNGGGGGGSTTPRPSNPSQSGPGVITEINPDEVPLGALPEETAIIPDGEVPLAALPKTGQESRRNAWCMLMAGLALTACGLFCGRREEDR